MENNVPTLKALETEHAQRASHRREQEDSSASSRPDSKETTSIYDHNANHALGAKKPNSDDFSLTEFLEKGYFEQRVDGHSRKRIGVVYKHLTVKGPISPIRFVKTLSDAIIGTFGPDLYKQVCRFLPFLVSQKAVQTRDLIHDFTGVVRDGEMLLVLGRPGAGCSTFLKTIANNRKSYVEVTGEVSYGGISAKEQEQLYRAEANYIPEEDTHLPELNVWQTLAFALMNKTKKRNWKDIPIVINTLLRVLDMPHTKDTNVGNEFVPGVSGGERKRVSIAEALITKSAILCLDNSTKGLDANTALDYVKSLRTITDSSKKATVLTLYQAGEGIYEQVDKVLLIDKGRCVFLGPAQDAKQYFVDLGFYCDPAQTTADFLTGCTHPVERRYREGYADKAPRTPEQLEAAFRASQSYQNVLRDIELYERELEQSDNQRASEFRKSVQQAKSNSVGLAKSQYTVSYLTQVYACFQREFLLLLGDPAALYTKLFVLIAVGFLLGSLFYGESLNSSGVLSREAALLMSVLFVCWLQQAELMKLVIGRDVIARQHQHALYRPSAVSIARIVLDMLILIPQVLLWNIIMYFMSGLDLTASKFWIQSLIIYTNLLTITAMYRMFASFSATIDDAVRFVGVALNVLIFYGGYVIPPPQLLSGPVWFGWLNYLNPVGYAFQAVTISEFSDRNIECDPLQLVPRQVPGGPTIDPAHQACSLAGSPVDSTAIPGSAYLKSVLGYERYQLWRNFGVLIAFMALYILFTALADELPSSRTGGEGTMLLARNKRSRKAVAEMATAKTDLEKGAHSQDSHDLGEDMSSGSHRQDEALRRISQAEQVFTWENIDYSLPTPDGQKQILNKIDGYCKPGVMVALMGVSGAGKTTLLNTLSQRAPGIVSGEILVDGKPPKSNFKRSTGFCEQADLHDATATIREAFEFSALLRQDRSVTRAEKIAYVDTVLDLLELNETQDTIISSLNLEQRKRVTIGVELVARPSLMLFLDEPTSGLDSQSAYAIIALLHRLAKAGQAILCTIHQPSSILMQYFDMILALNSAGNTFYFGPVGNSGESLKRYFAERGVDCPPEKNVAEFMLEITADGRRHDGIDIDWGKEWRNSDRAKAIKEEIHSVNSSRSNTKDDLGEQHGMEYEFAASDSTQTFELTKRLFRQYWRDPSYMYAKLFTAVVMGILNGFTFWKLENSILDMQSRMFSTFLIITVPAIILNGVIPKFFQNLLLWMAREHPSRTYGWFAFTTAQVIGEIPMAIIGGTIYWLLWYWPTFGTGQSQSLDSSTSGYVFFMSVLFWLFMASWGQWITAFAPSATVIANVVPLLTITFSMFNGIFRFYSSLPVIWRYTLYYLNPSQWWISGILAAILPDIPIQCAENEVIKFTPPPGLNCGQYAGAFANVTGGNLINPDALNTCNYCPLSRGGQYLDMLSISSSDKWRNLGIFCIFTVSNYLLVYFFIWSIRVKGWKFGMGYLFGFLERVAKAVLHSPRNLIKLLAPEKK